MRATPRGERALVCALLGFLFLAPGVAGWLGYLLTGVEQ